MTTQPTTRAAVSDAYYAVGLEVDVLRDHLDAVETWDSYAAQEVRHDLQGLRVALTIAERTLVRHLRDVRWSWSDVGKLLGVSAQAAQQRFGR